MADSMHVSRNGKRAECNLAAMPLLFGKPLYSAVICMHLRSNLLGLQWVCHLAPTGGVFMITCIVLISWLCTRMYITDARSHTYVL